MAVQSLRIKSHLQWVLKEMDTSINMQSILWPPSRLVVNSSLLYDCNSSRKSMFLVSPLISVTGNLLHSFNCMEVTQDLINSYRYWWENMRLPEMALKLPSMKIWQLPPNGQMLEASVSYMELYWWIEKTWWGSRFQPDKASG